MIIQEKLEEFKLNNHDIWLWLIYKREEITSEEIKHLLQEYHNDREASVSELCRRALGEEVEDTFLQSVCFNYELTGPNDISPALDDLSTLVSTEEIGYSIDVEKKAERYRIAFFGEKCAKALIRVFKEEIKPYLPEGACIKVTRLRAFAPELVYH